MRPRWRLLAGVALVAGLLGPAGQVAQAGPEVVGGHPAGEGEYPFMVGILHHGVSDPFQAQFCGGSLVSPDTVLTAAHCMEGENANTIDVLVGTNHLEPGEGTRVRARRIRIHPSYHAATSDNDLAIIQLGPELPQAVVPNLQPNQAGLAAPGVDATTIGWGDTSGAGTFPTDLMEVDVPIVSDTSCTNSYGSDFIARSMLCAGESGRDSCQGDSGGPLLVPDGGGWHQAGIVSWGIGCGLPTFPGVYTRVTTYAAFINPYRDPDTPPNAVTHASATRTGAHRIRASWQPPVFDGGTAIRRYRIAIVDLGRVVHVPASFRSYLLQNVPSGPHQVRIRAVNDIGPGVPRTLTVNV
jgi:secreted trypsin-like serine protease